MILVELKDVSDKYSLIRLKLAQYGFETNPVYCGHGLEVYHREIDRTAQMVVDLNTDQIRIILPSEGVSK